MAARIIVRREVLDVIGQAYPMLKAECRRQFQDEWERWRAMARTHGLGAALAVPSLVGANQGLPMDCVED